MFLFKLLAHTVGFIVIFMCSRTFIKWRYGRLYAESCKVEIFTFVFVVYVGLQFEVLGFLVLYFVGVQYRLRSLVREFGPVIQDKVTEETAEKTQNQQQKEKKDKKVESKTKETHIVLDPSLPIKQNEQEQKFFI